LGGRKIINIYIQTQNVLSLFYIHAHAAIGKERGLLNAKNSPIKYGADYPQATEYKIGIITINTFLPMRNRLLIPEA